MDPSSREDVQAELEQLRQAERRKDEFLGQLAHEVGNVLVPLPLALEVLKQPALSPTTIARVRAVLEEQAECIQRLISQLRSVSRLTRGVQLDIRTVELRPIVERAMAAVRAPGDERNQQLIVSLPTEPVQLHADPDRLHQTLVHLLENAVRYTPPGGRIDFDAARRDGQLVIRVEDNGTGIDPGLLPQVFEPFVRGEGALDWSGGRLGIGLSLVRQYVELHGGTVSAASAGPDLGSQFTVCLPLA